MPQASLPSPRTWSSGDLVSVPRLRADAANAVAFLLGRPMFAGQADQGPSWGSGTDSAFGCDLELTDNWNGHVAVSNGNALTSQYWAPVPGWYLCRAAPSFQYTSSTQAMFAGGLQGTTGGASWGPSRGPLTLCGSTHPPVPQCIDLVEMTAAGPPGGPGDYVQFLAYQDSGSPVNLGSAPTQLPAASARWVCATSGTHPLPVPPLTAAPSPVTHAWLNAGLRDTIRYLTYPPICRAYYANNGTTLPSSSFPSGNAAPLNSVTVDNYGTFGSTIAGAYTVPLSGRYLIAGQFNLQAAASSTGYCCGIAINGGTTLWGDSVYKVSDSSGGGAGFCKRVRLTAGQTVQLMACQGSGSAIAYNASGVCQTRLVIIWEGS